MNHEDIVYIENIELVNSNELVPEESDEEEEDIQYEQSELEDNLITRNFELVQTPVSPLLSTTSTSISNQI